MWPFNDPLSLYLLRWRGLSPYYTPPSNAIKEAALKAKEYKHERSR